MGGVKQAREKNVLEFLKNRIRMRERERETQEPCQTQQREGTTDEKSSFLRQRR
jgi:hypothetical protein